MLVHCDHCGHHYNDATHSRLCVGVGKAASAFGSATLAGGVPLSRQESSHPLLIEHSDPDDLGSVCDCGCGWREIIPIEDMYDFYAKKPYYNAFPLGVLYDPEDIERNEQIPA